MNAPPRPPRRAWGPFLAHPGDAAAQSFARGLGAAWAGDSTGPAPVPLDAAIILAPVGALPPAALATMRKSGTVPAAAYA